MKRAFTLIELIIVIVVIGILASVGYGSYQGTVEKSRRAEAVTNLGLLRQLQLARKLESDYTDDINDFNSGLPKGTSATCGAISYFFNYSCNSTNTRCQAVRCTSGGKTPPAASPGYTVSIGIENATIW